jgi:hypothetical protein
MLSLEFFIYIILPAYPGVDSASNRNEYQEYFQGGKNGRCVGLTTLPPSCADCLEIWEPQPPGPLRACLGLYMDCFTFTFYLSRKDALSCLSKFSGVLTDSVVHFLHPQK